MGGGDAQRRPGPSTEARSASCHSGRVGRVGPGPGGPQPSTSLPTPPRGDSYPAKARSALPGGGVSRDSGIVWPKRAAAYHYHCHYCLSPRHIQEGRVGSPSPVPYNFLGIVILTLICLRFSTVVVCVFLKRFMNQIGEQEYWQCGHGFSKGGKLLFFSIKEGEGLSIQRVILWERGSTDGGVRENSCLPNPR